MRPAHPAYAAIALLAAALALAGCDVRHEGAAEPTPTPTPSATPVPEATEPPVASIIREDALPGPIIEVPPEPLDLTIPFAEGGSALSPRAERLLADALEAKALAEGWPIILRGHTDSSGDDGANLRAATARADAVADWLVEHGVPRERITVIALGEQNPVAPNALPNGEPDEAGRARNRRVELRIAPPPEARDDAGDEEKSGEGAQESAAPDPGEGA